MKANKPFFINLTIVFCLIYNFGWTQPSPETQKTIQFYNQIIISGNPDEALKILNIRIAQTQNEPGDLAHLYSYKSSFYVTRDSLKAAKTNLDLSFSNAEKSKSKTAKAMALRARAGLNRYLDLKDEVVKDAGEALQLLESSGENNDDTKAFLNYMLYGAFSKWKDIPQMEKYLREAEKFAAKSENKNILANVYNGYSSVNLAKFNKEKSKKFADSSLIFLKKSFQLKEQFPKQVSANTFAITCINIANFYLENSGENLPENRSRAFQYLDIAEKELQNNNSASELWINIYGIRSDFAIAENNFPLAEQYLLMGLKKAEESKSASPDAEYMVYKRLSEISAKQNKPENALSYQNKAESFLKKVFDEKQAFNSQKLEIQYETEKKNEELKLQKNRNYLYAGLALASLTGLIFMFLSYHFKLRYSREREKQIVQEKLEAEKNAALQIKFQEEEQARLKAEQELLELKQKQLQKEVMANNLQIEQKNDMLKRIQEKIKEGTANDIEKILREEGEINNEFEEVINHIHQLHPNFFDRLSEMATQKLTALDLKYCAYLHLKMNAKQIADMLHVEQQSVRTFKYRLKQKFGLGKDVDLDAFLQGIA